MKEEKKWAPVLGYDGSYLINDRGDVKSLIRKTRQPGNLVSQWCDGNTKDMSKEDFEKYHGYKRVRLQNEKTKRRVNYQVHRLVWEAFNGKIPDGMQVNHINEIKDDNRLENLNLMTQKENINYGTALDRGAKKLTYSLSEVQTILDSKFGGNIIIVSYGGVMGTSTFKCNTCGDMFKRSLNNEQRYKGNGCLSCNRLARIAKRFEKAKAALNDKFDGNIVFTDTQYAGSNEQSHFKCLACGTNFIGRYDSEIGETHGNGHPRCPKSKLN